MVDLIVLILLVVHELFEFFAEKMHLAEIKWSKISEEGLVNKIVIDAEVESVLARLRRVLVTDPVESTRNDFNGMVSVSVSLASAFVRLYHFCL